MEQKKSPWKLIGGILLGLVGVWFCITSVNMYRYYLAIDPVTLDATVTELVQTTAADSSVSYDVQVTFTYEGKEYTKSYATTAAPEHTVGQVVSLTINKNDPMEKIMEVENNAMTMGICGSLFVGLGAMWIPFHFESKDDSDYARRLTARVAGRRRYRVMLIAPLLVTLVFMQTNVKLMLVGVVLLPYGLFDTYRFVRDLRCASRGKHTIRKDLVVGCRMRLSEKALFCTLKVRGKGSYRYQIPKTTYSAYVVDDEVTAIYLGGRKPEALLDVQTDEMI